MSLWLFIGRLNPPHNWHIKIIEKSLKENKRTLVLLWSPLEKDEKNPFSFKKRKDLLLDYFKIKPNLKIMEIKDNPSDLSWSVNIYKKLVENYPNFKNINFYAWDFKNDSAYRVIKRYQNIFFKYKINFIEISRKDSFVLHNWEKISISSTNFRKSLKEKNNNLSKKFTKKEIFENIK